MGETSIIGEINSGDVQNLLDNGSNKDTFTSGSGGQSAFNLSFILKTNSLVLVNGEETVLAFTGVDTTTITFTQALPEFTILTVKK